MNKNFLFFLPLVFTLSCKTEHKPVLQNNIQEQFVSVKLNNDSGFISGYTADTIMYSLQKKFSSDTLYYENNNSNTKIGKYYKLKNDKYLVWINFLNIESQMYYFIEMKKSKSDYLEIANYIKLDEFPFGCCGEIDLNMFGSLSSDIYYIKSCVTGSESCGNTIRFFYNLKDLSTSDYINFDFESYFDETKYFLSSKINISDSVLVLNCNELEQRNSKIKSIVNYDLVFSLKDSNIIFQDTIYHTK